MQELRTRLNTIRENVRSILARCPETRNNDRMLLACYMLEFHNVTRFYEYAAREDLPSLETIRRRRQEIQEQGLLLPTKEAVAHRRMMADAGLNCWRKDAAI